MLAKKFKNFTVGKVTSPFFSFPFSRFVLILSIFLAVFHILMQLPLRCHSSDLILC